MNTLLAKASAVRWWRAEAAVDMFGPQVADGVAEAKVCSNRAEK